MLPLPTLDKCQQLIDTFRDSVHISFLMTPRELRRILESLGVEEVRQVGSHLTVRIGAYQTVIPVHHGQDIATGTLRSIERALEPALGKGWLKR